jgi:hypothetical protein
MTRTNRNGALEPVRALTTAAALAAMVALGSGPSAVAAQDQMTGGGSDPEHRLPLTWDRWLDHEEIGERMRLMADTWPNFLSLGSLGDSYGGRELWIMTINNPDTGPAEDKAAMWIEANIHGNEIQGAEVSLYTIWYLMENYDRIPDIRRMVDERVFYIVPTINPDGRDYFMHGAGSGARTGHVPVDSDGDGLFDEDPPNDLNQNGVIEQIRKYVPGQGTHRLDPEDDRFLIPVGPGETGDWIQLGSEGIDDDGDGRINEDPIGGYDPNRNWGSDWQPNYIQGGSMNYPFELPESRAINDFMMANRHIAGVQSFHNSGGMILRGPGAAWQGTYPVDDIRVYDELGEQGERMLPYYNYYVIWRGLYTVHGGSIDWQNDGLGIISYSNELWNGGQYFNSPLLQSQQQGESPISGQNGRYFFDDFLEFGDQFVDWAPFDHPEYGQVEMGGWKKLSGRVNPRFMSMELFHRNMAFTLWHADQMPLMSMGDAEVERVQGDVWRVRIPITNERVIPTITVRARENAVVRPDLITVDGNVDIITAGWVPNVHVDRPIDRIDQNELDRILVRSGHPGRTTRVIEYLVRGSGSFTVEYDSVKGGTVSTQVQLR